jgi:hypothetical protein
MITRSPELGRLTVAGPGSRAAAAGARRRLPGLPAGDGGIGLEYEGAAASECSDSELDDTAAVISVTVQVKHWHSESRANSPAARNHPSQS